MPFRGKTLSKLVLFNKPYQVLSQFTDETGRKTLANYIHLKGIYPAGRLDYDSEGLLLLTDDGRLQSLISHPKYKAQHIQDWLRSEPIPIIVRVQEESVWLDFRTIFEEDEESLKNSLHLLFKSSFKSEKQVS